MSSTPPFKRNDDLQLSGLHIAVLESDGVYGGLGQVSDADIALRSSARPILPLVETPDGRQVASLYIVDRAMADDGTLLITCHPAWTDSPRMEWMLHAVRNRRVIGNWAATPTVDRDSTFQIQLAPREHQINGQSWRGFAYRYRHVSPVRPIYQVLDRATWEIGGTAAGNTVMMRSGKVPPRWTCADNTEHYSTEWYLPTAKNPNVFQFHPLQTQLQGFTFTTHPAGTLVTRSLELAHIRTLLEKPRGDAVISHWHELCGDLSTDFTTPWIEVLWLPGDQSPTDQWNLYHDIYESTADALHQRAGLRRERVQSYCRIEQWVDADLDDYRTRGLPALADAGIRWLRLANHFGNNMNVYGVRNMCCTTDLRVPDSVGADKLQALCEAAHCQGIQVEMWGNTAVSTLAWMLHRPGGREKVPAASNPLSSTMIALQNADDPFVLNPSGAIEADHYTPVFAVMNLRDESVRRHWMAQWSEARTQIGLDGIFLDSSFNLSSDKFHWKAIPDAARTRVATDHGDSHRSVRGAMEPAAQIQSMYHAHLSLMAQMQRLGYRYCGEDIGVFGVHASGPAAVHRLDNLPIWQDCFARFDPQAIAQAGADPDEVYFRGLAFRMVWMLDWHPQTGRFSFSENAEDHAEPTAWHLQLLRVFDEAEPMMRHRHIEQDLRAVTYKDGDTVVAWVFENDGWTLPAGWHVRDLTAGVELSPGGRTERHHVYVATT